MELIQELREAKFDRNVGLAEFFLIYKKKTDTVFCFVEAKEDELYYGTIMKVLLTERRFRLLSCNGKDGVLEVYSILKNNRNYRKATLGFFIDRDFDKKNRIKAIYETPNYSIENFYSGIDFLENLLIYEFRIKRESPDYQICTGIFLRLQKEFHSKVLNLNSILACYADLRAKKNSKRLPRLNIDNRVKLAENLIPGDLSSINHNSHSFKELNQLFNLNNLISKSKYKKKRRKLASGDMAKRFRGKFELFFMIKFLHKLKHAIEHPNQTICSRRYTTAIQFRKEDFTISMNSFTEVPDCLKKYVRRLVA